VLVAFIVNTDSLKLLDVLLVVILYILPLWGFPDTPASLVAQHIFQYIPTYYATNKKIKHCLNYIGTLYEMRVEPASLT
jgi:hypothetical protein